MLSEKAIKINKHSLSDRKKEHETLNYPASGSPLFRGCMLQKLLSKWDVAFTLAAIVRLSCDF